MPWAKYNYAKLKKEYFDSDILEIKVFCEKTLGNYHWRLAVKTKWWRNEKERYLEEKAEEEYIKNRKSITHKIKLLNLNILVWKTNIVKYLNDRAAELMEENKKLKNNIKLTNSDRDRIKSNNQELFAILRFLKTELWEPNNITKNENTDIIEEREPSEEDRLLFEKIVKWRMKKS